VTPWTHEGPHGVDGVEWWTRAGQPVGVTRTSGGPYTVAYVAGGEPVGQSNSPASTYRQFSTLAEAQADADRLSTEEAA